MTPAYKFLESQQSPLNPYETCQALNVSYQKENAKISLLGCREGLKTILKSVKSV